MRKGCSQQRCCCRCDNYAPAAGLPCFHIYGGAKSYKPFARDIDRSCAIFMFAEKMCYDDSISQSYNKGGCCSEGSIVDGETVYIRE